MELERLARHAPKLNRSESLQLCQTLYEPAEPTKDPYLDGKSLAECIEFHHGCWIIAHGFIQSVGGHLSQVHSPNIWRETKQRNPILASPWFAFPRSPRLPAVNSPAPPPRADTAMTAERLGSPRRRRFASFFATLRSTKQTVKTALMVRRPWSYNSLMPVGQSRKRSMRMTSPRKCQLPLGKATVYSHGLDAHALGRDFKSASSIDRINDIGCFGLIHSSDA